MEFKELKSRDDTPSDQLATRSHKISKVSALSIAMQHFSSSSMELLQHWEYSGWNSRYANSKGFVGNIFKAKKIEKTVTYVTQE